MQTLMFLGRNTFGHRIWCEMCFIVMKTMSQCKKTLMLLKIELINAKYNCLSSCLNRFQTCDIFFTLCENNCPQHIFCFPWVLSRSSLSHTHARTHHTHTHTLVNTPHPRSAALCAAIWCRHNCLRGQRFTPIMQQGAAHILRADAEGV